MSTFNGTLRVAFSNRTNASLPVPADSSLLKRPASTQCGGRRKHARVDKATLGNDQHKSITCDTLMGEVPGSTSRRNCTVFNTLRTARMQPRRAPSNTTPSSRPILSSFVSSSKSDVYRLHSRDDPVAPGLPFACAFTTDAKRGGIPILAVATQDGTVELINVAKRQDWDSEPQRTVIQVHDNAILDAKWGQGDRYLATSSGDTTTRITAVSTQQSVAVLTHHTASVKALDWNPSHADILSTGSRDGSICVWDLRTGNQNKSSDNSLGFAPVVVIPHAHCDVRRGKAAKTLSISRTVTSILYLPQDPQQLISSGSFDGLLKQWDLRYPTTRRAQKPVMIFESYNDPTLTSGLRGRGLSSLAMGRNHTSGRIWGLATDSCIYSYTQPLSAPFDVSAPHSRLSHSRLFVNSFYIKLAASPCGNWLASGSSGGGVYLWDVGSRTSTSNKGVEMKPTGREVGALDWASGSLAACCDDGTVQVWRPDYEVSARCKADPEEKRWDWTWTSEDL